MKEAIIIDLNGHYIEPTIVDDDFNEIEEIKDTITLETIAYIIPDKVPEGLYIPQWDFNVLEWIEGLTQEEIDTIRNTKQPLTESDKINLLSVNTDTNFNLAKAEIDIKTKIANGEITATNFADLTPEEQSITKLALFKEYSPKPSDISKSLSAIEFALVGLYKILDKAIDRTRLTSDELTFFDALVSTFNLNDMPITDTTDWRYQYLHTQFEETQVNRQAYFAKKIEVIGEI